MGFSLYACAGCQAITNRAANFTRLRGDRWCGKCAKLVREGKPTPRETARANGEDDRGGLTKLVAAMAGEPEPPTKHSEG
jgi:hypothetical protein